MSTTATTAGEMPVTILVSRCFGEVDPESLRTGNLSDSGFVYRAERLTFRELVREIRDGAFRREGHCRWLTAPGYVVSYFVGTERTESLHFDDANPDRLRKWFDLAVVAAHGR